MKLPSASTKATVDAQPQRETDTRLRGRWLLLVRVVWVVIAVLALGLVIASIPGYFSFLHVLCTGTLATCKNSGQITPGYLRAIQALGLSLDSFATYQVALVMVSSWATSLFSSSSTCFLQDDLSRVGRAGSG